MYCSSVMTKGADGKNFAPLVQDGPALNSFAATGGRHGGWFLNCGLSQKIRQKAKDCQGLIT